MLARHRWFFAPIAFLLLVAPLAVGLVHPDSAAEVLHEGRSLAPAPSFPRTASEWRALPGGIDAYLKDHFGMRSAMIRTHKDLTKPALGRGSDTVMIGRDGRMFVLGEQAVQQSAGLVVRDERLATTVEVLAAMNRELQRQGIRFLVAMPPNTATVFQEDLPSWAQRAGRPTEYDLLLKRLTANGVRTVDLRPAMLAAKPTGPIYYRHDSHWQPRGALAGYNAIVEADGHPDWRAEPKTALTSAEPRKGGDLARLLGVEDRVSEYVEDLTAPGGTKARLTSNFYSDFVQTADHSGPTILVLGDSFTADRFTPLVLQHASKVIWLDDKHCAFDWTAIDRFRPDEVWWMPTERFLLCTEGAWPLNFPVGAR